MGTFLLLALLCLIAAGVVYAIKHPEALGLLQQQITAAKNVPQAVVSSARVGYRSGPALFTEQVTDLSANAFIKIRIPGVALPVQLQVITVEILHMRKRSGTSGWVRKGGEWPAVYCKADPTWSQSDVLIVVREWGSYVFKKRTRLGPEDAKFFASYGAKFEELKQKRGGSEVEYEGRKYAIQDVGVYDVESSEINQGHIPSDPLIARFLLAHDENGDAFLIEDAKDNHDSIWVGYFIEDIDRAVVDVLTKNG